MKFHERVIENGGDVKYHEDKMTKIIGSPVIYFPITIDMLK